MRNIFITFLVLLALSVSVAHGQEKKRLSHDDYAGWRTLIGAEISPDGNWVIYQANPQDGDGELIIRNIADGSEFVIPRGYRSSISPGGKYLVSHIKPQQAVERQAKVEKRRRNEMPSDSLAIFVFATRELEKVAGLASYRLPEEPSDWMAYLVDFARVERPKPEPVEEPEDENGEDEPKEEEKLPKNKWLYIYNPVSGERFEIEDINDYIISPYGTLVAGIAEVEEDTLKLHQVHAFDTHSLEKILVDSREGPITQISTNRDATHLAWLHSGDTAKTKVYDLYLWERRRGRLDKVVDKATAGMPEGYSPSEHRRPSFSHDGRRLFFGTAPIPEPEPEDTLLPEEKYRVDVWHWQDPLIQPIQQVRLRSERNRNFMAVYHLRQGKMVQLADEDMPGVSLDAENNTLKAMGSSPVPYQWEIDWSGTSARDIYIVDVNDGSRKMILEAAVSTVSLSPGGNFLVWYDQDTEDWFSYNIRRETTVNMTADIDVPLYNEENDVPRFANPHGIAGWTTDDQYVLINDRHDIWQVDPTGRRSPELLTQGYGRENNMRLRLVNLHPQDHFVDMTKPQMLDAFHYWDKRNGYYSLSGGVMNQEILEEASLFQVAKARDAWRLIWRRGTFNEFTDLWTGDMNFGQAQKISDVNPQQADYYWGSVQLVDWTDFDGETLQGLLYLPEDFDPEKQYPMLVYFYERSSHGLYQHFIPSPSRSTINRSYCTSNGYIVFVPDITYKDGFPGESAYNAIVSGTKAMIARFPFIDRHNMGLQGQSWGGYQIAYLITRTNMFKAAMAGAPVSNMVSAYGGIRWQTGRSRQFQYEYTQSRIGGTLWEKPFRYIENSPVFFVDKIETPLLMMHNDDDGAVPWYQGIEMFMAMRRLQKPVWMLVYNGEAHNLMEWPNRMDLSVRMYQFFDYYLKGEPAPVWLKEGIPAIQKGRMHGYELIKE
jgi:dienelactone hydrolase